MKVRRLQISIELVTKQLESCENHTYQFSRHTIKLVVEELTLFFAPVLEVARIAWHILQDRIPLDEEGTRTHESLEALEHFVDDNNLRCVRLRRC